MRTLPKAERACGLTTAARLQVAALWVGSVAVAVRTLAAVPIVNASAAERIAPRARRITPAQAARKEAWMEIVVLWRRDHRGYEYYWASKLLLTLSYSVPLTCNQVW